MITFVLAVALLVGALCVGAEKASRRKRHRGVVASHVLAAGPLANHAAPVALSHCRCEPVTSKARQERAVTVF